MTDETFRVSCRYCGEELELFVEADVVGTYTQDCEVCCQPWLVRVRADSDGQRELSIARDDGSE